MYKRSNYYANGTRIPDSLPESYQPSTLGNAPVGQKCLTCKNFNATTFQCSRWTAPVRPRWWCAAWEQGPVKAVPAMLGKSKLGPYKRVATSIVEEHFASVPKLGAAAATVNDPDVIQLNVPLMIRLLEYAKEDAKTDMDLHMVAENLIDLSEEGEVLDMESYEDIVDINDKD